jgi:hypothetical protein
MASITQQNGNPMVRQNDTPVPKMEGKESGRSFAEYVKLVGCSLVVTLLLIVDFYSISMKYCILQLHPVVNFILLFISLTLLAYVEALHYGAVAIEKWDMSKYAEQYPRVVKLHSLVDTPKKLKQFLVGRQFFVIFVVFLIAEITSFPYIPDDFAGLPKIVVIIFIRTGLPGVALVLTFGQLISQLFVEEYTVEFLNLPGNEFVVRLSLAAEYIGVCNFSWLLYHISSRLCCKSVMRARAELPMINSENGMRLSTEDASPPLSPTQQIRGPDFDLGVDHVTMPTAFDMFKYIWSTVVTLGSIVIVMYGISIRESLLPVGIAETYFIFAFALTLLFYLEGLMIGM